MKSLIARIEKLELATVTRVDPVESLSDAELHQKFFDLYKELKSEGLLSWEEQDSCERMFFDSRSRLSAWASVYPKEWEVVSRICSVLEESGILDRGKRMDLERCPLRGPVE